MKTRVFRYFSIVGIVGFIAVACSTGKDTFVNRNFHSVTTKYNVMYNGNLALEAGLQELAMTPDNYWEVLPVERMQITEPVFGQDEVTKNANFVRAEDKATKAIEQHSMSIGGVERNPQMDEAYLLLGKARYYDQRFIPALEAFNFIMYKYPDSDRINEIKLWREKTNIRLESNILAIQGLKKVLREADLKDRGMVAEANAMLAQAFYNEEQNDSAIVFLKKAKELTRIDENKARYTFILGQLLEKQDKKEEAVTAFGEVIEMNRKSPREYVMQSHAKIASINKNAPGFIEKFDKLLKDRENRPYLDVLNHQVALHYDKLEQDDKAVEYYNKSLKNKSGDKYRVASNYRNIAEINFYNAKYSTAGKYYDSTLVHLDNKTREFRNIKRKRENLEDVIKYEAIAVHNDSILALVSMSESERDDFFKKYIERLKEEDKKQKELEEVASRQQSALGGMDIPNRGGINTLDKTASLRNEGVVSARDSRSSIGPPTGTGTTSNNFYFYNQTSVATGKSEFRKKWGSRALKDYWRLANYRGGIDTTPIEEFDEDGNLIAKDKNFVEPRFTTEFYTSQIPTDKNLLDSLQTERNFAYYQLGIIYKDKFKEYELAQSKLENLLESNPEERLILPSMYNLYKIYEVLGSSKMASMKSEINSKYPDSRYAYVINNPNSIMALEGSADLAYKEMFKIYESGDFRQLLTEIEPLIDQYSGEEIIAKLECLKANAIGNLKGVREYKKALNYVALTYPNSMEGKDAENLLNTNIPKLEKLDFGIEIPISWKLIYKMQHGADISELTQKLDRFMADRPNDKLKITLDSYTLNEDFVVIHNINTEQKAKDLITLLEEYKDYKIKEKFVFISSDDYKVVQIKKNFNEYLQKINPTP